MYVCKAKIWGQYFLGLLKDSQINAMHKNKINFILKRFTILIKFKINLITRYFDIFVGFYAVFIYDCILKPYPDYIVLLITFIRYINLRGYCFA